MNHKQNKPKKTRENEYSKTLHQMCINYACRKGIYVYKFKRGKKTDKSKQ